MSSRKGGKFHSMKALAVTQGSLQLPSSGRFVILVMTQLSDSSMSGKAAADGDMAGVAVDRSPAEVLCFPSGLLWLRYVYGLQKLRFLTLVKVRT